ALRLLDDLGAGRCDAHFARAALEQRDAELVLQLLHRDRQRRLRHEAGLRCPSEMALARHRDDVAELGERHLFLAKKYSGMPIAMTIRPASTRLPNFGP